MTEPSTAERPGVLHVLHGGGGTEQHARTLIAASRGACRHYLATAVGDRWRIEDHAGGAPVRTLDLVRAPDEPWPDFVGAIAATLRIALVHVHHLSACRDGLLDALASTGLRYGITVHDLWLACPTVTLTAADGRYCGGQTDAAVCARCLSEQPALVDLDIVAWRDRHRFLVAGAAFLIAPSRWAAGMVARYFGDALAVDVIPHAAPAANAHVADADDAEVERDELSPLRAVLLPQDDVPTVAVVGAIGPDKGARRVERLAQLASERGARVRFVVIGYLDVRHAPWQRADAALTIHGAYDPRDLARLFAHYRVAFVAYPSEGPESFSLTLSEAWAAGLPALVPPIGALAERVAESRAGWVWTYDEWRDEARMLERIVGVLASPEAIDAASARARGVAQPTLESMAAETLRHYRRALDGARVPDATPLDEARVRVALGESPAACEQAPRAPQPASVGIAETHPLQPPTRDDTSAAGASHERRSSVRRALRRVVPAPLVAALKGRLR